MKFKEIYTDLLGSELYLVDSGESSPIGVDVPVVALGSDAIPVFRFCLLLDCLAASSRDAVMIKVATVFAGSTLCT